MIHIPKNLICCGDAFFELTNNRISLRIPIIQFSFHHDNELYEVDTEIWLDGLKIPIDPESLSNKTYEFPINPTPGYIDGSIYLFNVHNPVDVTSIVFDKYHNNYICFEFKSYWLLEYENTGFGNLEICLKSRVKI